MLVDVARQYEADLIVIGTKGIEGAGPVIVGAVAEQLVRCRLPGAGGGGGLERRANIARCRAGRCCWPWSAMRLRRRRWPWPVPWRRPFSARCW